MTPYRPTYQDRLKSWWSTFRYNYSWPRYVGLFDGWLAKCALGIPVVGYLILFNDGIASHLAFDRLANEAGGSFGLNSGARLKLIYFGLISVGMSNLVYRLRRPFVMRFGKNELEYVESGLRHFNLSTYIHINGEIKGSGFDPYTTDGKYYDREYDEFLKAASDGFRGQDYVEDFHWVGAKNKYESLLRSMLREFYFRNVIRRRFWLSTCLVLAVGGYALLMIPSLDLFFKVVRVVVT